MQLSGQSFSKIPDAGTDDLGFEQLQRLIENLVQQEAARKKTSPNDLIRVVRGNEVVWMTAEEADTLLASDTESEDDRLRNSVERALKGETRILHVELRAMIALGMEMLDRYAKEGAVDPNEVKRIRPIFIQLERRINTTVGRLKEIERRIQDYRRSNPIFDEFEGKMGRLLNLQRTGKGEEAAYLAQELVTLRKRYLFLSRGLASDTNVVYGHRLDLQKNKKTILSNQKYLAAQRAGMLEGLLEKGRARLGVLCRGLPVEEAIKGERKEEIVTCMDDLKARQSELKAVSKGLQVIEIQEKEVESVISHVIQNVVQEEPAEPDDVERTAEPQQGNSESGQEDKPKAASRRMATVDRRR
ncbi:MAG TPA: hypothetical protein PK395_20425 [bacterium]|nr:hypothetical protein [bacterium]HQP98381.1 hypothetical protein [bacterium]